MSNAQLFMEAIDTAITLGRWFVGWLIVGSAVASILTLAAIATGAHGVRAVWRRATGPAWRRGHIRARLLAARRLRRPKERTEPRKFEEAA